MAIEIVDDTPQEERATEEVFLLGEGPIPFTYPKMGAIMNTHLRVKGMDKKQAEITMGETIMNWLRKGFGPDVWAYIERRLEDEADRLETVHLINCFTMLVEAHAKRPTSSSSGASPSPWTKSATDEQSQPESDSELWTPANSAT